MQVYGRRDIGKRRTLNQDYIFFSADRVGNLPNLFIVADGMGGHKAGDVASRFTTDTLVELITNSDSMDPVLILKSTISTVNSMILEKASKSDELKGMGTTLCLATIFDNKMYVANVGDSRLYAINKTEDTITQITNDHSYVAELVRIGEISAESARNHPEKNKITRAIGAFDSVNVDLFEIELQKNTWILLCSDGLTNMVRDEEIKNIVNDDSLGFVKRVDRLIDTANANGGNDNIAVILINPFNREVL